MPHFGLMDESGMPEDEAALLRARLHIRCGLRRLKEGKLESGISTLYDAVIHAMKWHVLASGRGPKPQTGPADDLDNDRLLFAALVHAKVVDDSFDFNKFEALTEQALDFNLPEFDRHELMQRVERLLTQLGVMPFDEKSLPPEDPATF